jgi:hypothetical protein
MTYPADKFSRYGNWALVTGASSGIGMEFARQLASQGMNLVLVARRGDLLTALAQELTREFKVTVKTIDLDLTGDGAVERLFHDLSSTEIGLVVMSAGIEITGHFTKISLKRHIQLEQLNIDVPMRMSRLFGEAMVSRRRGALIFVSSVFGYQGVPVVANYAASKAYILTLGEALNVEMKPHGVDVLVLSPGLTDTPMPAQMPVDLNRMPITKSSPKDVVHVALRSLGNKATVIPGFINKFYAWENRLIPRSWPVKLFGWLIEKSFKKSHRAELLYTKATR